LRNRNKRPRVGRVEKGERERERERERGREGGRGYLDQEAHAGNHGEAAVLKLLELSEGRKGGKEGRKGRREGREGGGQDALK